MARGAPSRRPSRRLVRWSLLVTVNAGFLLLIGTATVRETYRDWQVNQQIQGMESQVSALEGRKVALMDVIQRLDATSTLDKEARAHLGMKLPGERVILLRGTDGQTLTWNESADMASSSTAPVDQTNPQKWFSYFFHADPARL